MNDELKQYLKGMEGRNDKRFAKTEARIADRFDQRFESFEHRFGEQAELTSKAFTNLEKHIDERFAKVDERLDRIENVLLARHEKDIERLIDDMRLVKTKLSLA